ncbi:MAG: hypothetical protein R3D05_19130 [Dongiaceae bacterium]
MHKHSPSLAKAVEIRGGVRNAIAHDSAAKYATGAAIYIDDIPELAGTLHAAPGLFGARSCADWAFDLSKVQSAPAVVMVLTASDIPGMNDVSPIGAGDVRCSRPTWSSSTGRRLRRDRGQP